MKIHLKRLNEAVHFSATNEEGLSVDFDGSPAIGGEGKGVRPMEMVLMAAAACSSIDVISILKKMRQPLQSFSVDAEAMRRDGQPATFSEIHLHYSLSGDLDEDKVEKAISLSLEKYCSVSKMLEHSATITSSYTVEK